MPTNNQPLSHALTQWPNWGLVEKPRLVHCFDDGQNHHAGLIESAGKKYVLKVFEHSFDQAVAAQEWASALGVAPRFLYASSPIAVMEFIDSSSAPSLTSIGASLRIVHQAEPLQSGAYSHIAPFDLLRFCELYLNTADALTKRWHAALLPALEQFIEDQTPWCFCHNDLVTENCMLRNGHAVFIDWEFAMLHNPWFDLAAIIMYFELDLASAKAFLDSYRDGWAVNTDRAIFHSSQLALLWGDLLWNMNKYGNDYRDKNPLRFTKLQGLAAQLGVLLPT